MSCFIQLFGNCVPKALAVCRFNNGAASLYDVSKCLDLELLRCICARFCCSKKTFKELRKLITNPLNITRNLRRRARAKRKDFEDKNLEAKGEMYSSGAFDIPDLQPGPSKRQKD